MPANRNRNVKPAASPYLVDVRTLVALGLAALAAATLVGFYLWMVRPAAAREVQAACNGMRPSQTLVSPAICGSADKPCSLPQRAPDFTVIGPENKPTKLSSYLGKVVLVNFWASWCGTCKAEKRAMSAMARDLVGDDFVVLTVAADRDWAKVLLSIAIAHNPNKVPNRFKREQSPDVPTFEEALQIYGNAVPNGTPYRVGLDRDAEDGSVGPIGASWGVKAMPDSFLIDRMGRIRYYFVNKRDWDSDVAATCIQSVIDA